MSNAGGLGQQAPLQLPRAIDANKFASAREPEILALCAAVKQSKFGDNYGVKGIPRHLRRRTRSHNPYKHTQRPNIAKNAKKTAADGTAPMPINGGEPAATARTADAPPTNRQMRRRPGKLQASNEISARWSLDTLIHTKTKEVPLLPPRRLETHVWHAKRLAMQHTEWGCVVAEGEPGKGRGSRAFMRVLDQGCAVHDASYWCPLLLTGSSTAVESCLENVLGHAAAQEVMEALSSGSSSYELDTTIYQFNSYPRGALGPARVMSMPPQASNGGAEAETSVAGAPRIALRACIWVHAACAAASYDALTAAIASDKEEAPGMSLEVLDLRRIELRGQGADAALAGALFPSTTSENDGSSSSAKAAATAFTLPPCLASLQAGDAVDVVLPDPRLVKPVVVGSASGSLLPADTSGTTAAASGVAKISNLLDTPATPPMTEAEISKARQQLRRQLAFGEVQGGISKSSGATHCPAILVRQGSGHPGYFIILPPGWVMPVWLALIFQGCRAAGQREWRWMHTLGKLPFFPHDTPDTLAYTSLAARIKAEQEQYTKSRPKGRAPPALLPPWESLQTLHLDDDKANSPDAASLMQIEKESVPDKKPQLFVARSVSSMVEALFGTQEKEESHAPSASSSFLGSWSYNSGRPVANALAQGHLEWRPVSKFPQGDARDDQGCLVETLVYIVKRGRAEQGAAICVLRGEEGDVAGTATRYLNSTSGSQEDAFLDTYSSEVILPNKVQMIGYISSSAPLGAPPRAPSMGLCSASAFWRLRSLQYYEPRRDHGMVYAWLVNPNSTALHPIRLSLRIER